MDFEFIPREQYTGKKIGFDKLIVEFYEGLNNCCEKFIQNYADEHDVSFDCAYYFLKRFYDITIDVEIEDGRCYCIFTSKCRPLDEVLSDGSEYNLECENELWSLNF